MEAPRALQACIRQTVVRASTLSSAKGSPALIAAPRSHRIRPFSTSTTRPQDDQNQKTPADNQPGNQSQSRPTSTRGSSLPYGPGQRPGDKPSSLGNLQSFASRTNSPSRDRDSQMTAKEMLDNLLGPRRSRTQPQQRPPPSPKGEQSVYDLFGRSSSGPQRPSQTFDPNNLLGMIDSKLYSDRPEAARIHLRLKPSLGRTVEVGGATNLTRAFRTLEAKCSQNNVRRDEIKQRFHVRAGQKRKLERSARWRALFKEGFMEACGRVRRMRKQGW